MGPARHPRILLVEDESLVSMLAEDILADEGYEVILAMRLQDAVQKARGGEFDAAILDINLGDAASYPAAEILRERHVPFLFATGYGVNGLREDFKGTPVVQKPYDPVNLARCVRGLLLTAA